MDCFSLKCKDGGISSHFIWHDCKCELPTIKCRTSPFLKHKYITRNDRSQLDIDLNDLFIRTEDYIWEYVLPKEGNAKYSWLDFSEGNPDNNSDLQPPEEVITQPGGEDPPEEVLSSSDIAWKVKLVFYILGTTEKDIQITGSRIQRYRVIMIRMVWRHTKGTLTQMHQVHN